MKLETLCWTCQRSMLGCSWSKEFKPVEGWEASVTSVKNSHGESEVKSFCVKKCPLYLRDEPREIFQEDEEEIENEERREFVGC